MLLQYKKDRNLMLGEDKGSVYMGFTRGKGSLMLARSQDTVSKERTLYHA